MTKSLEETVKGTVRSLAPHFVFEEGQDLPSHVLANAPRPSVVVEALKVLIDSLLPGRIRQWDGSSAEFLSELEKRLTHAASLLAPEIEKAIPYRWCGQAARLEGAAKDADPAAVTAQTLTEFLGTLPEVRRMIVEDVRAAYEGDPSALTFAEVVLAFPGILAIVSHRVAHELYKLRVPMVPRIMSEWTHTQTGVDINPGARIGEGFFIDHGTGVVIGETTVIGDRVKLYQGVTLGARSFTLDSDGHPVKHIKRHPTVENDVVIYANAIILGGDTVIGAGSTIGGGVFLMESVPAGSTVFAKRPEHQIKTARPAK